MCVGCWFCCFVWGCIGVTNTTHQPLSLFSLSLCVDQLYTVSICEGIVVLSAALLLLLNLFAVASRDVYTTSARLLRSFVTAGYSLLDLAGHRQESLIYILGGFGRSFQKGNACKWE